MIDNDASIPIDIDTHMIGYNHRLKLLEHYHFDFRYLFLVDKIDDVKIDTTELSSYQWINIDELISDVNYGKIVLKIKKIFWKKYKIIIY